MSVLMRVCAAESRKPVKDCFLAVLSSHGEEGCVFGADGKPVRLAQIFKYFDNEHMEKKAKLFLIQVGSRRRGVFPVSSTNTLMMMKMLLISSELFYFTEDFVLFLSLQACRGDGLDDGVEVDSAGDTSECSFSQHLSVPIDTAVMYATAPGKPQPTVRLSDITDILTATT